MTQSILTKLLQAHVGRILAGGVLAAALGACSAGPTRELADARRAYDDAQDSAAARQRPNEMARARIALDRAEAAHDEAPGSDREIELARRAEYRARLAMARADAGGAPRVNARDREYEADVAAERRESAAERREAAAERREQVRADARADAKMKAETDAELAAPPPPPATPMPVDEKPMTKAEAKKAEAALQNLGQVANVKQEARGVVITLSGSLLFPSGNQELSPIARKNLDQVAHALSQQPPSTTFVVEGYTDDSGSEKQNDQLAAQRAKAVADHLVQAGIDPSRVRAEGHGEHDPVASNDTPEGRASNRRVEILLSQQQLSMR